MLLKIVLAISLCAVIPGWGQSKGEGSPKQQPECGIVAVEIAGVKLRPSFGKFTNNFMSEWVSIPGMEAEVKIHNKKPTIKITMLTDRHYDFYLVRFEKEVKYRYFYINSYISKEMNLTARPAEKTEKMNHKQIAAGVYEFEPDLSLFNGEYAIYTPRGLFFDPATYPTMSSMRTGLYQWLGGVFWEFGIAE